MSLRPGTHIAGTPERAADMVRAANIRIDAGYSTPRILKDAMDVLQTSTPTRCGKATKKS